jgi:hypothetical protein
LYADTLVLHQGRGQRPLGFDQVVFGDKCLGGEFSRQHTVKRRLASMERLRHGPKRGGQAADLGGSSTEGVCQAVGLEFEEYPSGNRSAKTTKHAGGMQTARVQGLPQAAAPQARGGFKTADKCR